MDKVKRPPGRPVRASGGLYRQVAVTLGDQELANLAIIQGELPSGGTVSAALRWAIERTAFEIKNPGKYSPFQPQIWEGKIEPSTEPKS